MTHDLVRNPAHYTQGRKYEPIDVIEDWELSFHLGNALKYISRAGRKDPSKTREDISKAIWYLERFQDQDRFEINYDELVEGLEADAKEFSRYYGETLDEAEAWPELADSQFTTAIVEEKVPFDATDDVTGFSEEWEKFWNEEDLSLNVTESSVFVEKREDGPVGAQGTDSVDWDIDEEFMWDPSLGPIELSEEEIASATKGKDLSKFTPDSIVTTVEKRGFVLGIRADGSTCELGKSGKCK